MLMSVSMMRLIGSGGEGGEGGGTAGEGGNGGNGGKDGDGCMGGSMESNGDSGAGKSGGDSGATGAAVSTCGIGAITFPSNPGMTRTLDAGASRQMRTNTVIPTARKTECRIPRAPPAACNFESTSCSLSLQVVSSMPSRHPDMLPGPSAPPCELEGRGRLLLSALEVTAVAEGPSIFRRASQPAAGASRPFLSTKNVAVLCTQLVCVCVLRPYVCMWKNM
jgi:hypothetical protein